MDSFDREILQFVLWWKPFGFPPGEEAYPRFGLRIGELADRFVAIVRSFADRPNRLDPSDRDLLLRARQHLTDNGSERGPHGAERPTRFR